ncbi:hypothetical protein SHIRM173S_08475 [Streptomyces hirsutus]
MSSIPSPGIAPYSVMETQPAGRSVGGATCSRSIRSTMWNAAVSSLSRWSRKVVPFGKLRPSRAWDSSNSLRASACGVLVSPSGWSVLPYSQLCLELRRIFCTNSPSAYRLRVASVPPPPGASGIELRTTIELVGPQEVNCTYWPVESRRTDLRPEDSVAKLVWPNVRLGSAVRSVPR